MRIGLIASKQYPFIEFDQRTNRWRLWMMFNKDVSSGTYYDLYPDGACERVTVADRDVVEIALIA